MSRPKTNLTPVVVTLRVYRTWNQFMSRGVSSVFVTTAITLRRSEAGSSPSFSSFASPSVTPDIAPPARRVEPVVAAVAALLPPPPPSQARNVAHLLRCDGVSNQGVRSFSARDFGTSCRNHLLCMCNC